MMESTTVSLPADYGKEREGDVAVPQASHGASQGKAWKPPGFPWHRPEPLIPPSALAPAPFPGQTPEARLSHGLTCGLGAQPVRPHRAQVTGGS